MAVTAGAVMTMDMTKPDYSRNCGLLQALIGGTCLNHTLLCRYEGVGTFEAKPGEGTSRHLSFLDRYPLSRYTDYLLMSRDH